MTHPDPINLAGTVKYYERHLFVCTGAADWAPRIELGGGFAQSLAEVTARYASEMARAVKITACDLPSSGPPGSVDLLVFPDNVRYEGLTEADIPLLVRDHLAGNRLATSLAWRELRGRFFFVCVHGARDERCGRCGPPLADAVRAALAARGLAQSITVAQTSHVGGHAYAGNVLVYPPGDWYGLMAPEDAPRLVQAVVADNAILANRWRGRMGVAPEPQAKRGNS
jgi:(2Fe-2S) ferredoxin